MMNRTVLALTSRFIEKETGIEYLCVAVGQINFTDPRISLPFPQVTSGRNDLLLRYLAVPTLSTDSNIQMDESRWVEKPQWYRYHGTGKSA